MVKDFIDGVWRLSESEKYVAVINPATKEVLDQCPLGTTKDVDVAVKAAHQAFHTWRRTPPTDRVQYLFKLRELLLAHADELATLVTKENGKILSEARGSVKRGIQMVETACGMPSLMQGEVLEDIATGIDCTSIRQPMGVFAGIVPFNFPAMVPFWFWPFAVASGNTFVLKPSERVPLTQARIFELIEKAGFPKGVINMIQGGKEVAHALLTHPLIKGVSFVGSTPVAKQIYTVASQHGKRVQALGGAKNFMVALPDAVLDESCKTAYESITGCAGERCLAGSVVLCVGDKTYAEFCERMAVQAKETVVGNGLEKTTHMGPVTSEESKTRIKNLIEEAVQEGAKILFDGRKDVDHLPGYFLRPTVLPEIRPHMKIAQEEVFGPVVLLAKIADLQEGIKWINNSPFANTATLFTSSGAAARQFVYEADPAMLGINIGVPAPMSFFSFGGAKDSFFGDLKAHGKEAINFYTNAKVTTIRWHSKANVWG